MQVAKWGDSLAIRIPSSVAKALVLKEGDDIEVAIAGPRRFELERQPTPDALLARADFRFDRLEANERG
jgi:antitoxin MazE